ncbi:hypothetical protein PEZ76_07640, partial [Streptococcus thermophilus]|uniref:hypothetical protein n=1 Tax=Streptococcus thermophilus TaxID=1308 RepID=UPI0022EB0DE7
FGWVRSIFLKSKKNRANHPNQRAYKAIADSPFGRIMLTQTKIKIKRPRAKDKGQKTKVKRLKDKGS